MEWFIVGLLCGVIFILSLSFILAKIEEYEMNKEQQERLTALNKLVGSAPVFSGLAGDDYIPSYGEVVFSLTKQAVVLGDGKTSVKDLEILSYYEGD